MKVERPCRLRKKEVITKETDMWSCSTLIPTYLHAKLVPFKYEHVNFHHNVYHNVYHHVYHNVSHLAFFGTFPGTGLPQSLSQSLPQFAICLHMSNKARGNISMVLFSVVSVAEEMQWRCFPHEPKTICVSSRLSLQGLVCKVFVSLN